MRRQRFAVLDTKLALAYNLVSLAALFSCPPGKDEVMSLRFNVAQLLKSPPGTTREYQIGEDVEAIAEELVLTVPLAGGVKFIRTADGVLVLGDLKTSAELICDRCLEPFVAQLELRIEEEYHPTVDISTGGAIELGPDQEMETLIDESHIVDLGEVLRQDLLLALPMHPICRPNCAGLCPHCGQNLNEGRCDCASLRVDPRLAHLATLLRESDTGERS